MTEWLQIVAVPLALVAVILRRTERRTVSALKSAAANSEASAIELPTLNRLSRWQIRRLEKSGALVETSVNRCYFNPSGYTAFRGARRRRAMVVVPVIVVTVLVLWYLSR